MTGKGRFVSLMLKQPKGSKKPKNTKKKSAEQKRDNFDGEEIEAVDDFEDVSFSLWYCIICRDLHWV
jgi:hypothetical protein